MKRRTATERNRSVEAKKPSERELAARVDGSEDAEPDVLAFLDEMLAEGRALVRSKGSA